jgi:hypothetical protein
VSVNREQRDGLSPALIAINERFTIPPPDHAGRCASRLLVATSA